MPVVGVEVFQSGDGPEPTATWTDVNGRFALGGFQRGPVFLFARGEGFRFRGRLIKPDEGNVTVELTRTTELPAQLMRMLPDAIPLTESRTLVRRLMEPTLEAALNENNESSRDAALRSLAAAVPTHLLLALTRKQDAERDADWLWGLVARGHCLRPIRLRRRGPPERSASRGTKPRP